MQKAQRFGARLLASAALVAIAAASSPAHAQTYQVLHSFVSGGDGADPSGDLIQDDSGNLYGTTLTGGASNDGTVFELNSDGVETVLYQFSGGADGREPRAGVIRDSAGNLYGTTIFGGDTSCPLADGLGCGTVFKLEPSGQESVLYRFQGGTDGAEPTGGLLMDSVGNLFGTTLYGGANPCLYAYGCGTIFKIDHQSGAETVIFSFDGSDGQYPLDTPIQDSAGNLYGSGSSGGTYDNGVIWELDQSGAETVLHSLASRQGADPAGGLIRDSSGNLYGTANGGGEGVGTVFELSPSGKLSVLIDFSRSEHGKAGARPLAGLTMGTSGTFYGTTAGGGDHGYGTVFKVDSLSSETLYNFSGGTDGGSPWGGLLRGAQGSLYGTAKIGGANGYGVVFKITLK